METLPHPQRGRTEEEEEQEEEGSIRDGEIWRRE